MFSSTDFELEWDGTIKGKTVTAGVYFWVINYQFPNGEEIKNKGQVTVLKE